MTHGHLALLAVSFFTRTTFRYILEEEQDVAGREGQGGHWPVMCGERGALLSQRNHPSGAAGYGRGSAAPGGGGARPLEEEPLVHWCHGSSGAVLVFCKAFQVLLENLNV